MRSLVRYFKSNPALSVLLLAFFVLAIFYSLIIPLFEGPDEDDHFRYVKYIADHRALPVQRFETGGGEAGHQGWHPPLYYALAALLVSPIDTSDYSEHLVRNEYVAFVGDAACCGRNIYYHFSNENFPYTRTTLAVHLARLLSILFGAITAAATYAIATNFLPLNLGERVGDASTRYIPLAVASVIAFNPSFLFVSALVSNDAALAAFSSLVLLLWVKLISGKLSFNGRSSAILGALVGLALLTKTTALGLVPLTVLLFAILAWRQRNTRLFLLSSAVFSFVNVLVTGWWFVRNQILYGDALALQLVSVSALFPREGPLTLLELVRISLPQMWRTFWGGPTPADFSPDVLVGLAILAALASIGVVFYILGSRNSESRISIFFLAAWLALILVSQIQFIRMTQGADQGRYLFSAISVFGLFFVLGLLELFRRISKDERRRGLVIRLSSSVIGLGFLVLALVVLFIYTLPAYAHPVLLSQYELTRFSDAARTNFANQIELLGYELDARSHKPGETLRVTLYWRALAPMQESYRVFVHLVGNNDTSAGGVDAIPARGAFPTIYWKPGDALRDDYYLPITPSSPPRKYLVEVGLYPIGKPGERLTAIGSGNDRVVLGPVKIGPRESITYVPSKRVNANFADQIELMGYDAKVVQNQVRLILYWRARLPLNRDYTVFVHALDASGKIIAQMDGEPQGGNYPTSIWDAGEQVRDEYVLDLPAKNFRIGLGLYRADTGERLPVNIAGQTSDHLELNFGATP